MRSEKNKKLKQKIVTIVILGLTFGSIVFLVYSTYLWVNTVNLYYNLQDDITINEVQIFEQKGNQNMNVTLTIQNKLLGSHIKLYIAFKGIINGKTTIPLEDPYKGLPSGAFKTIIIPQQSASTVKFNFPLPEDCPKIEGPELKLIIRILASTILNEEQPQSFNIVKSAWLQR